MTSVLGKGEIWTRAPGENAVGTRQRLGDPSTSRQVPGIPQTPEAGREAGPRFSTSSGGTRPSDTVNSGPQPPAIRSWPLVPPALGLSSIKRAVPGLHGRGSNPQDRPWTPRLCEPPARKHHVCGHVLPPRVSSGRSPPRHREDSWTLARSCSRAHSACAPFLRGPFHRKTQSPSSSTRVL